MVIGLLLWMWLASALDTSTPRANRTYSQFLPDVQTHQIKSVTISSDGTTTGSFYTEVRLRNISRRDWFPRRVLCRFFRPPGRRGRGQGHPSARCHRVNTADHGRHRSVRPCHVSPDANGCTGPTTAPQPQVHTVVPGTPAM
jgi:hypothetical protein